MGSYDNCKIICPACHSFVDVQSKAGDCSFGDYPMEKAPLAILDDIQEESKHGRIECFSCGCALAVVVTHSVTVRPLTEQKDYDEDWAYADED